MNSKKLIGLIGVCLLTSIATLAQNTEKSAGVATQEYPMSDIEKSALAAARLQLEGYNNRDIELFLSAYADTVKVFRFPATLNYQGKEQMRTRYAGMFERTPLLHCHVVSEIVRGNKVIHEERVRRDESSNLGHAVAIYVVDGGKITEVYFL